MLPRARALQAPGRQWSRTLLLSLFKNKHEIFNATTAPCMMNASGVSPWKRHSEGCESKRRQPRRPTTRSRDGAAGGVSASRLGARQLGDYFTAITAQTGFPSTLPWRGLIWSTVSSSGLPSSRKMKSYWRESSGGLQGW